MTDQAKKQVRRRRKLLSNKRRKRRIVLLALVLFLGSGAFLFHKEKFVAISEVYKWFQQNKSCEITDTLPSSSVRGDIYDRNFRALAATYKTYAIYARPLEMENAASSANIIAEILDLDSNKLLHSLKSERGFVWVARGIGHDLADSIEKRNIKGVYQVVESKRFYPNNETAAHAVGFVENDQGLDGIEFQYNSLLRGDTINNAELEALHFSSADEFGTSGANLVLNLDLIIQSKIERFLEKRAKITGAASGAVLLMNANTGAIHAMASYPPFNPNNYWEFSSSVLNNHAFTEPVYPGELALIFQQAAAINLNNQRKAAATMDTSESEPLPVIVPDKVRKRRKFSIAPRVDYVEPEYLSQFAKLLSFDQKPFTDLALKDETAVSESLNLIDPSFHTSAIRLLVAFTALFNNGSIVTPHILHKAYTKEKPTPIEPDLSPTSQAATLHPETTKELTDFLKSKWLISGNSGKSKKSPLFFEAHRFATSLSTDLVGSTGTSAGPAAESTYISQSVMLGAIPGVNPELTMIALLSYPDSCEEVYPESLEIFEDKFAILRPNQEMIKKMLHVASLPPPDPSPDFWDSGGEILAKNIDNPPVQKIKTINDQTVSMKSMPNVTGKSLRAGLQVLQYLDLNIKIVGSGRIISQIPPAGAELIKGAECILEMQQEI